MWNHLLSSLRRSVGVLLATVLLAACGHMDTIQMVPKVDHVADPKSTLPAAVSTAAGAAAPSVVTTTVASNAPMQGAIFNSDRYRPLFEDHRARLPGDTLTIVIAEKVSASQSSTSSVDKSGSLDAGVSAMPLLPGSISARLLPKLSAGTTSANAFSGKGTTENSNVFSGTITASVAQVLPNGHLVVVGEKQIGVNANVDVLRFSGQVDPRAITPGNVVPSTAIANVRIEQRGRGQQAEAQSMGGLSRFFLSLWPF